MPWNYGSPEGNLAQFGHINLQGEGGAVASLANAIAKQKQEQTENFQKTLAQSIQEMAQERAANEALGQASDMGLPGAGGLEGMGAAGFKNYAVLAKLIQDQKEQAAREAYYNRGGGYVPGDQPDIVDTEHGPMIRTKSGFHQLRDESAGDSRWQTQYDRYQLMEQKLLDDAEKERKKNVKAGEGWAGAHPQWKEKGEVNPSENVPFSKSQELSTVQGKLRELEAQREQSAKGGAGGGAGGAQQYPVGTKVRTGEVWHTMTDSGWDPPL